MKHEEFIGTLQQRQVLLSLGTKWEYYNRLAVHYMSEWAAEQAQAFHEAIAILRNQWGIGK